MPEHDPIGPQAILDKKQRYLIPCTYHFYRDPPQIVRGQGIYVYDSTGRRYMDLYSGVSVHALGHCHPEMVEAVERTILTGTSGRPAAMFVEPVQGNGGIMVPPPEYFPRLREILTRYGTLLVADEVQTGFGRTGRMFAMEHWTVTPNIITGGNTLGGGTPVGFFSTTDEIAACYTRPGASTFGGNPVTAQAGLKLLEILQHQALVEHSARMGTLPQDRLKKMAEKSDMVSDVRGLGLMVGVEIAGYGTLSAAEGTDRILERMKDGGYLLGKTGSGRNVLTWMPPLIIRQEELMEAVEALEKTLQTL